MKKNKYIILIVFLLFIMVFSLNSNFAIAIDCMGSQENCFYMCYGGICPRIYAPGYCFGEATCMDLDQQHEEADCDKNYWSLCIKQ
ncbi:hypothetical protein ACFL6G_06675 [candidate division KSB1 bacterium]